MNRYFYNIANALTELLGAVSGITYNSNETTSGAAYRRNIVWLVNIIDALFFWQEDHCKKAAINEIKACKELLELYGYLIEHSGEELL